MLEKDIEKHLVWAVELFGGKAYKFTLTREPWRG
jgi:hypothetical protein